MIPMIHPITGGSTVAVNEDQARLLEGREWLRVDPSTARVDYSGMRKGQLLDAAEAAGLDVPEKVTVGALRELLEAHQDHLAAVLNEVPEAPATADQED